MSFATIPAAVLCGAPHFTSNLWALRVIVDESDADHAAAVLSSFYRSGARLLGA